MELSNVRQLIKWILIIGGIIVIVNMFGAVAYLSIIHELDWTAFIRLLSSYLMLEGLVIMLMGCMTFFGFKKYTEWPTEEARRGSEQNKNMVSSKKIGLRMNFGTFLVILGMLLFLISFIVFSFSF